MAGAPVRVAVPVTPATATESIGAVLVQVGPSLPQPSTLAPNATTTSQDHPERRAMPATVPVTTEDFNVGTAIRHPTGWRVPAVRGIPEAAMHAGRHYSLREVLTWTRRELLTFLLLAAVPPGLICLGVDVASSRGHPWWCWVRPSPS